MPQSKVGTENSSIRFHAVLTKLPFLFDRERIEEPFTDKKPHLYQLVVRPDNTYSISLDQKVVNEGSLLTDFTPAVNPPKEIDDPKDFKPENWDEREKVNLIMVYLSAD